MTNAAIIEVGDRVIDALKQFKGDRSQRAVKLVINSEALAVAEVIRGTANYRDDFGNLADHLNPKEPCYLITRLDKSPTVPEFVLIVYIPVGCPVRPRTIFASGRVPVQRQLTQLFTGLVDFFVDDARDLTFDGFVAQKSRDESVLSAEERMERDASQEALAAVSLPQPEHDQFTWPVDDDLRSKLETFGKGGGPPIVAGKASDSGGAITCAGVGSSFSQIDHAGPRYVAVRRTVDGSPLIAFVLFCPDSAPARQKMMSSTCKASFLKGCKEAGIEFAKKVEIRDAAAWADDEVDEQISPKAVSHGYGDVQAFKKPTRPGRKG